MVVDAITNVTAFVGRELESQVVDLHLRDGRIDQITAHGSVVITDQDANVIDGSSFLAFPPAWSTVTIICECWRPVCRWLRVWPSTISCV